MREEIAKLLQLGSFPKETVAAPETVELYTDLISAVSPPVTLEETKLLLTLFGTDNFFGVAWSLVHLIESSPEWTVEALPGVDNNIWITLLRERLEAR